jgi:enamine deaminase RidA (YjgF/YER057c/UK114 family)
MIAMSLPRIIDAMVTTLMTEILPNIDDESARAQAAALANVIANLRPLIDWAAEPLAIDVAARRDGLAEITAAMQSDFVEVPAMPELPRDASVAALQASRRRLEEHTVELLSWLARQKEGPRRTAARARLHALIDANLARERHYAGEPAFGATTKANRQDGTDGDRAMSSVEQRLQELGLELPPRARSVGNYLPYVRAGNLVLSVQGPLWGDELRFQGRLGRDLTLERGQEAARLVMLNLLVQLRDACDGDFSRVRRCVRLGGFVNSSPEFNQQTLVMNGASDLLVAVLGERGRHARFVVGCSSLPFDLAVEIEGIFEID